MFKTLKDVVATAVMSAESPHNHQLLGAALARHAKTQRNDSE